MSFTRRRFFGLIFAPLVAKLALPPPPIRWHQQVYSLPLGRRLRVESLEMTLSNVTYSAKSIQPWKDIPKLPAYSTIAEYEALIPADMKLIDVPELKGGEPIFLDTESGCCR